MKTNVIILLLHTDDLSSDGNNSLESEQLMQGCWKAWWGKDSGRKI